MTETIVEISDDVSWDEQLPDSTEDASHDWKHYFDESGTDVRGIVISSVGTLCFVLVCCMYLRPRWFGRSATQVWALGEADPKDDEIDPELRAKVVKAIFAEQKANDTDFLYDEESQSLQWTEKCNESMNPMCSICLDKFTDGDLVISSQCSHVFHRECVMEWIGKKDDCPMCRQPMWDDEKYKELEDEMKVDEEEPAENGGKKLLERILNR